MALFKRIVITDVCEENWDTLREIFAGTEQLGVEELPDEFPEGHVIQIGPEPNLELVQIVPAGAPPERLYVKSASVILSMFNISSERKYTLQPEGRLFRIKSLINIPGVCAAGDFGGLVKNYATLSHSGNCWIAHSAMVLNGTVAENAQILGESIVDAPGGTINGAAVVNSPRSRPLTRSLSRDETWPPSERSDRGMGDVDIKPANKTIAKFMESDSPTRYSMIRCGFELETQQSCGWTKSGPTLLAPISINLQRIYADAVSEVHADTEEEFRSLLEAALTRIDRSRYRTPVDLNYLFRDMPATLQKGTDGSVQGFEFRTRGGLTVEAFHSAADYIFSKQHVIDAGCSFHVHISLPGVKHQGGQRMCRLLTEYVLSQMDRLPEGLKARLKGNRNWYQPRPTADGKHQFVNCHEQGTWEFRCFGNIQTAAEAKICLDIAIEAMHYAYSVRFVSKTLSPTAELSDTDWTALALEAMKESKPIKDVLPKYLKTAEVNS